MYRFIIVLLLAGCGVQDAFLEDAFDEPIPLVEDGIVLPDSYEEDGRMRVVGQERIDPAAEGFLSLGESILVGEDITLAVGGVVIIGGVEIEMTARFESRALLRVGEEIVAIPSERFLLSEEGIFIVHNRVSVVDGRVFDHEFMRTETVFEDGVLVTPIDVALAPQESYDSTMLTYVFEDELEVFVRKTIR